ncbi:MAG: penicillin acylase family protein, partial [Dehalococcoidia bacterium]
ALPELRKLSLTAARVGDASWEPMLRLDERFEVRGENPVTEPTWLTRHGPVIAGDPMHDDEVIAARWGLAEPAHDTDAMLAVLRAGSVPEARAAFRRYDSVSGNFCFADGDGNIAYQYTGRIPKRPGWIVPVPGWDNAHEWDGDVPKDELPGDENPRNGFIVTANNRTTGDDYPHYLSYMSTRFRADRLRERMDGVETFDPELVRSLQGDQTSIHARELAARFAAVAAADAGAAALRSLLSGWDGALGVDSPAAVAYATTCDVLIERTVRAYYAQVPNVGASTAAEEFRILYEQLLRDRPAMLMGAASWDDAIRDALPEAARRARARHGADPAGWRWGAEHAVAWDHNLGRDRTLAPVVNIGNVEIGGDGMTPFASEIARGAASTHGVSYRQIFDLSDLAGAQICIPPGNSGQPGSPHYGDNVERWRAVEYHPLLTDWDAIAANAEARLTLEPGD